MEIELKRMINCKEDTEWFEFPTLHTSIFAKRNRDTLEIWRIEVVQSKQNKGFFTLLLNLLEHNMLYSNVKSIEFKHVISKRLICFFEDRGYQNQQNTKDWKKHVL